MAGIVQCFAERSVPQHGDDVSQLLIVPAFHDRVFQRDLIGGSTRKSQRLTRKPHKGWSCRFDPACTNTWSVDNNAQVANRGALGAHVLRCLSRRACGARAVASTPPRASASTPWSCSQMRMSCGASAASSTCGTSRWPPCSAGIAPPSQRATAAPAPRAARCARPAAPRPPHGAAGTPWSARRDAPRATAAAASCATSHAQ
eukprot:3632195-Pleurochrysis_carterae.AAC.1